MPFKEGRKKTGGRTKGAVNKLTKSVKEGVLDTFNKLQEDKKRNMLAWAEENLTEFYKIASKLIPTEVSGKIDIDVEIGYEDKD